MDDTPTSTTALAARYFGVAFGIVTQTGFLVTVWFLFAFLKNGVPAGDSAWLGVDSLLALQFAIVHSLVLYPATRRYVTRYVRSEFYGSLFCLTTCVGLAVVFHFWRGSPGVLWELSGFAAQLVRIGFYASWVSLFYSLYLSGLGQQTGLTPWWSWVRRRPAPRRDFTPRSLYRWFRHPIYLSFLGLIWFTPRMSGDHALLTGWWTLYIFVGSYLKDERLAFYLGEKYRLYQASVPGYPMVPWGPLARRPLPPQTAACPRAGGRSLGDKRAA